MIYNDFFLWFIMFAHKLLSYCLNSEIYSLDSSRH